MLDDLNCGSSHTQKARLLQLLHVSEQAIQAGVTRRAKRKNLRALLA